MVGGPSNWHQSPRSWDLRLGDHNAALRNRHVRSCARLQGNASTPVQSPAIAVTGASPRPEDWKTSRSHSATVVRLLGNASMPFHRPAVAVTGACPPQRSRNEDGKTPASPRATVPHICTCGCWAIQQCLYNALQSRPPASTSMWRSKPTPPAHLHGCPAPKATEPALLHDPLGLLKEVPVKAIVDRVLHIAEGDAEQGTFACTPWRAMSPCTHAMLATSSTKGLSHGDRRNNHCVIPMALGERELSTSGPPKKMGPSDVSPNGNSLQSKQCNITPQLQTSQRSSYARPIRTSGATKPRDPHCVFMLG
mmetsp:Transcript_75328/g.218789  ORF Transcript_75328/g.218789 Transcript_75328/m.218789 type:complete len:308 (+) Transcript_75328:407-1330(+)